MIATPRLSLLLNWYANPYHTPVFMAHHLGFYKEEGLAPAIMETTDPSDVTDLIGQNKVDIALKAMVHSIAARAKGYKVLSIGTLFHEPPTGLIFLKSSGIKGFDDIRGKRIGYIGRFGKIIIDDLARRANIEPDAYETIRVGMNITDAIIQNKVDAGMGIGCFQQVELEQVSGQETGMLRVDELAGLGCCCFCSILFLVNEAYLENNQENVRRFMRATLRGTQWTLENPEKAYELLCEQIPRLRTDTFRKIYISCLPYFSRDLINVDRDWEKVGLYAQQLGITDETMDCHSCYTNEFLPDRPYSTFEPLDGAYISEQLKAS
ncbi:ABC transporter substrate-binding protein [Endozoicomonas elysicola]|uniref:Thiamine pyrimidine synthase n=1 Tax=Endozoicomonas elysicola TaxID=305900 RepID=A0A081KGI7_9GAMM|nr:ABC transporter substrate-binding protein [Endozoicomonas elysicola]KEI73263.1 thiamine biosynthesis protein [Endozoicomonas elysicola]